MCLSGCCNLISYLPKRKPMPDVTVDISKLKNYGTKGNYVNWNYLRDPIGYKKQNPWISDEYPKTVW